MIFTFILIITNGFFIQNTLSEEELQNETNSYVQDRDSPKFGEPIQNVTISVGRDAVFACVVDNLQTYKIAWLRVDTQTILTIQTHVITKNHRMVVTHAENRAWILRIRDVKEADKGWYMCQINTDPMKNQVGFLNVVVPPDILDYESSSDMVVREGSNVTFKCAASGSPAPTITWRKESGDPIAISGEREVNSYNGSVLTILKVNRLHMGAYLCIGSNGIPPSVSKRVMLIVHFPPMVWIQNQLVGAALGQKITLECQSEAYPKSINYWMKNDSIIIQGNRFDPITTENAYKTVMKLTIKSIEMRDFGAFKCIAKNSLGDTDGSIKLYQIPQPKLQTTLPPTTTTNVLTTVVQRAENMIEKAPNHKSVESFDNNIYFETTSDWRGNNRERDQHLRNEGASADQMNRDLQAENEISSSTSFALASLSFKISITCLPFIFTHVSRKFDFS